MKKHFLLIITLFGLFLSCKNTQTTETKVEEAPPAVEPVVEVTDIEGHEYAKSIYNQHCTASCHEPKVMAFINRTWKQGKSWNEIYTSIKTGHNSVAPAILSTLPDSAFERLTDFIMGSIEQSTRNAFPENPDYTGVIKSQSLTFKLDTVVRGLVVPWGIAWLPDGDMLVTDRNGKFYRHKNGEPLHEIKGVPEVKYKGQGGLLDVEIHPNFATNQIIYLAYSKPKSKGSEEATTAILKAKLVNDALTEQKIIFEAKPYQKANHHYGCRMEFDKDGLLFFSVGDRGNREELPQSLESHGGKIHRIKDDGSIPTDNPFVKTPKALGSIWSYGQRNPQGLYIDNATGIIWETEHAPRGGDEVNIIQKGLNYGWPVISYGIEYGGKTFTDMVRKEGMEQPNFIYMPSIGPSGLTMVTSDKYPGWKGNLLAGSLSFQYISRLKIENNKAVEEEKLLGSIGRLREVKQGPDGYIYFSVEDPGYVFRIMPAEGSL